MPENKIQHILNVRRVHTDGVMWPDPVVIELL